VFRFVPVHGTVFPCEPEQEPRHARHTFRFSPDFQQHAQISAVERRMHPQQWGALRPSIHGHLNIVATFTGLYALYLLLRRRSVADVFLTVYLFAVFAMPSWCRWMAPKIPKMTFHETAILPVAFYFFLRHRKDWRWSFADILVYGLVALMTVSEYVNAGYNEAQNLGFGYFAQAALPYTLAKCLIEPQGLRVRFVKRIIVILCFVTIPFAYEFRFGVDPYRWFTDIFFPGTAWVTTMRYGFSRAAGPYAHCILAGAVFLIGFRLQVWLEKSGHWEKYFRKFRPFGMTKARIITIIILLGLIMTLARGPQIGAVLATVIAAIGAGRNPIRRAATILIVAGAIGIPVAIAGYQYAAVGRAHAKTASQESAAYRKELLDKYMDIAESHAALGWGRNGWPKVLGMPSIDNYYLLLALMHGIPASMLLVFIQVAMMARLLRNGFANAPCYPPGSSLSFTMAGIYLGLLFTFFTVFLGESVIAIFFLFTGFAEGYLLAGGDGSSPAGEAGIAALESQSPAQRRFEVVLA
jgi:hypothetical protein